MDLDEWEYLPDDGFLDFSEDGGRKIFVRGNNSGPKGVFDMNYFICPSSKSDSWVEPPPLSPRLTKQLLPLPIRLEPPPPIVDEEVVKHITKVPLQGEEALAPAATGAPSLRAPKEADQEAVSQVFFKKMKENEFVDMKMDSPKSGSRGILPQIEAGGFQFEEKDERMGHNNVNPSSKKNNLGADIKEEGGGEESGGGGFNVWKWSLTGIGALCSFGVAATTICIIIFASSQRNKHQQHNQKLRFQIITDDKVSSNSLSN